MAIDGVKTNGQLSKIMAKNATASTADAAPTQAAAPSLTSDTNSIHAAKLGSWYADYNSATPENIQKIKDTFQDACGRQPSDYELEHALIRADIRGIDDIINSIETSTEAAIRKYGSTIDSMIETGAENLRPMDKLDQGEYKKLVNNPDRKAWFADMMMQGQDQDLVAKRIENRLEKQDITKLTEEELIKKKDPDVDAKDPTDDINPGDGGKVIPTPEEEIVVTPDPEDEVADPEEGEPWDVGDDPIEGTDFSSVGDPHETTGDGLKFDNMAHGEFVKLMSASGDLVLQTRQKPAFWNPAVTVNTAAAAKLGKDVVEYNGENNEITINGKKQKLEPGQTLKLPDGGSVTLSGDTFEMISPKGDRITIKDIGEYIDVTGSVSKGRKNGEIRGSLGVFDSDTMSSNDMLGRTGSELINDTAAFIEEWRVQGEERLFNTDEATGEGTKWTATAEQQAEKDFMLRDLNNDGKIADGEMTESLKGYDRNGDGTVTKDEFLATEAALAEEAGPRRTAKTLDFSWLFDHTKQEEEEKRQARERNRLR